MKKLTRPNFCTTVAPYEYDFVGQFDDAMKAANEFHAPLVVDKKCPPPYYPVDMGKVYGLVAEVVKLQAQLAEAVGALEYLSSYKNYTFDGYVKTDDEPVHVTEFSVEVLKKLEE